MGNLSNFPLFYDMKTIDKIQHNILYEKTIESIFRDNLKFYRLRAKISQEKLSGLLDKNINYINTIEGGKSIPPLAMIEQIAEILKVEPHCFLMPMNRPAFDKNRFIEEASSQIASKTQEILTALFED